jgi:hypothetical protein
VRLNQEYDLSFTDSVPEAEAGVTAVMRRYPHQALPTNELSAGFA